MKPLEIFKVKRLGNRKGKDKSGDWFGVQAIGNASLVQQGESPVYSIINGCGGNDVKFSRQKAQNLVDALNGVMKDYFSGEFDPQ